MKKNNLQIVVFILIFLATALLAFSFLKEKNDTQLCRAIFYDLLNGSQSVQKYIDWENFKAMGMDLGDIYKKLPNAREKADFRSTFIKSVSMNFRLARGRPGAFVNWKVLQRQADEVIISAYYADKQDTILFTVSGYPKRKLISMQWKEKGA